MLHDRSNWWIKAGFVLISTVLTFICLIAPDVHAQSLMRSPNINFQARIPTMNPRLEPRLTPNIAARTLTTLTRTNRNLYPACSYAYRDGDGGCRGQPVTWTDGGGSGGPSGKKASNGPRRTASAAAAPSTATIARQIVAEIDGSLTVAQTDELARRHGLARLQLQNFPLIGATIGLFRLTDRRPVEIVSRQFSADASVRQVQPNFRYMLQDQKPAPEGDPAQYALSKLRLPEAHTLAHGANVTIAVIDSGIDVRHPELINAVTDSFDALGSKEGAHVHGTGVAGAIVAHARLMGSAPAARVLAIRAFGTAPAGAESTSFVVLKALDYAVAHGAQIVNMSFAGPKDRLLERGIAAAATKGIVMVAASGNAGPKSAPLYPAANPNVIAVSATDAKDKLFLASNRGGHIAVAAPGVDIFLPAPDEKYQVTSGTSFSAAYVSGIVALMLERNPALTPTEVRATLMHTARDLGPPGRDDLFGAGEADAYAALAAVAAGAPVIAATGASGAGLGPGGQNALAASSSNLPAPATASEKPAMGEVNGRAAQ